jgi:hypothetical protein
MKRPTNSRSTVMCLLTTIIFSLVCTQVSATKPTVRIQPLNLDMKLTLPDTILLNQPFSMTLVVTVNDTDCCDPDYLATIKLGFPQFCEVVEGDPVWKGTLSQGSRVSLRITAKFTQPQIGFFQGYVDAARIPERRGWGMANNVTTSRYYVISGPATDSLIVDSQGRSFIVRDTHEARQELPPRPPSPTADAKNKQGGDNVITITLGKKSAEDLGTHNYYRNRTNRIVLFAPRKTGGASAKTVPKNWSFDCRDCSLTPIPDSTARINLSRDIDSATLRFEVDGRAYRIHIKVRSFSTVSGYFWYATNFGDTAAGYGTLVELYGWENGQPTLCDAQIVATDGRYSLSTDQDHVTLEFWSCNSYCYLPYSAGCWNAGDPLNFYVRKLEFDLWDPGGVNELDPVNTTVWNLNWAGAFNICRWIQTCADFVNQCCGDPGVVLVRWGYNCSQPGTYYRADTVKILSTAAGDHSDRDEWDKSVILHEYGHHFTNRFAEFPDSFAGAHYWDDLLPTAPYVYEHLAWNEAIAT